MSRRRLISLWIASTTIVVISLMVASYVSKGNASAQVNPQQISPDEIVSVLGFSVQMGDLGDADTAWEGLMGGELTIEVADASVGSDQFRTLTPGHKVVGEVVLTGPVLGGGRIDGAELLENGAGKFSIDLEGLGDFSTNIRSVDIEPLTIDIRDKYRQIGILAIATVLIVGCSRRERTGA